MNPIQLTLTKRERILGGLWGSVVGDALGVPVEFQDRSVLKANPVTNLREYGTHRQPKGTWSDDTSLSLCTMDSLLNADFDIEDMGRRFVEWMYRGLWTPWGEPFDVGIATSDALVRIANGGPAANRGGCGEYDNGNGSLMRILPVALRFSHEPTEQLLERIHPASAITHGHLRSQMACGFYALMAGHLLAGCQANAALNNTRCVFETFYNQTSEIQHFRKLLDTDFISISESLINSSSYVIHTLNASIWCLLNSSSYEECVLKAVNLGGDSDTTGCAAGGLAGLYYGLEAMPEPWRKSMARAEDLERLFARFADLVLK